jgi:hypothetical protein
MTAVVVDCMAPESGQSDGPMEGNGL